MLLYDLGKIAETTESAIQSLGGSLQDSAKRAADSHQHYGNVADGIDAATNSVGHFAQAHTSLKDSISEGPISAEDFFDTQAMLHAAEVIASNADALESLEAVTTDTIGAVNDLWKDAVRNGDSLTGITSGVASSYTRMNRALNSADAAISNAITANQQQIVELDKVGKSTEELTTHTEELSKVQDNLSKNMGAYAVGLGILAAGALTLAAAFFRSAKAQHELRQSLTDTSLTIDQQDQMISSLNAEMSRSGMEMAEVSAAMGTLASQQLLTATSGNELTQNVLDTSTALQLSGEEAGNLAFQYETVLKGRAPAFANMASAIKGAAKMTALNTREALSLVGAMDQYMLRMHEASDLAIPSVLAAGDAMKKLGGDTGEVMNLMAGSFDLTNFEAQRFKSLLTAGGMSFNQLTDAMKSGDQVAVMTSAYESLQKLTGGSEELFQSMRSQYADMYGVSEETLQAMFRFGPEQQKNALATQKALQSWQSNTEGLTKAAEDMRNTYDTNMSQMTKGFGTLFAFVGSQVLSVLNPVFNVFGKIFTGMAEFLGALERDYPIIFAVVKGLTLMAVAAVALTTALVGVAAAKMALNSAMVANLKTGAFTLASTVKSIMLNNTLTASITTQALAASGLSATNITLASTFGFVTAGISAAASALWAFLLPFAPIIAAVAAVVGVFYLFRDEIGAIWQGFMEMWAPIKQVFLDAFQPIFSAFNELKTTVSSAFSFIFGAADKGEKDLSGFVAIGRTIGHVFKAAAHVLTFMLKPSIWTISTAIKAVTMVVRVGMVAFKAMWDVMSAFGSAIYSTVVDPLTTVFKAFDMLFSGEIGFADFFSIIGSAIIDSVMAPLVLVKNFLSNLFEPGTVFSTAVEYWSAFVAPISNAISYITDLFGTVFDIVTKPFSDAYSYIKGMFSGDIGILEGLSGIGAAVQDFLLLPFTMAFDAIGAMFGIESLGGTIVNTLRSASQMIMEALTAPFIKGWDMVKSIFDLKGLLSGAPNIFTGITESVMSGLKGFINNWVVSPINKVIAWDPPVIPGGTIGEIVGLPEIPQLAAGGITTGPTIAEIGEKGREAVIPLDSPVAQQFFPQPQEKVDVDTSVMEELLRKLIATVQKSNEENALDLAAFVGTKHNREW